SASGSGSSPTVRPAYCAKQRVQYPSPLPMSSSVSCLVGALRRRSSSNSRRRFREQTLLMVLMRRVIGMHNSSENERTQKQKANQMKSGLMSEDASTST